MADTPCGCDLAVTASETTDPRGRRVLEGDARRARAAWQCGETCAGGALPPSHTDALRRVERIVGIDEGTLRACPGSYTRTPDVRVACDLYRWFDRGQLALRCPHPSGAIVDALDQIAASVSARERDEITRAREARKTP